MVAGPLGKDVPNVMSAIHGADPAACPGAHNRALTQEHTRVLGVPTSGVTRYHNNHSPDIPFTCVHTI